MSVAQKKKQAEQDQEWKARFEAALERKTFRKPPPAIIKGNRSHAERALSEDGLRLQTRQMLEEFESQCAFYSERLGHDVMWVSEWLQKYWAAWSGGVDEALVRETVAEDCVYKDPLSFGRPLVGVQEFIDYNQAVFDGVPDLAYCLIPGQVAIQVSPEGEVLLMGRYVGCGYWDNPIRMYPFKKGSPAIPGTGQYIRITGLDRYHFNADRKVCRGETLWDPFEALQLLRVMPSDTSLVFKAMMTAGGVTATAARLRRRLPLIGGE